MKRIIKLIMFSVVLTFVFVTNVYAADVAKIGTTNYDSISAAIDAVQNNEEIVLLADASKIEVPNGKKFVLNLGNNTVDNIINSGNIEIKNGTIHAQAQTLGTEGLENNNGGFVTLNGVRILSSTNVFFAVTNDGTITVEDATFSTDIEFPEYVNNNEEGEIVFENANMSGYQLFVNRGRMTINGGTYTATSNTISSTNYNEFVINGGTFNSANDEFMDNTRGTLTINGGTFNCKTVAHNYDPDYLSNTSDIKSTIIVNGGTFNVTEGAFTNASLSTAGYIYFNGGKVTGNSVTSPIFANYSGPAMTYITGGTIVAKSSMGLLNSDNSGFVLGKNDGNVSTSSPTLDIRTGTIDFSGKNSTFEFYDGKIIMKRKFSDNWYLKSVKVPSGYEIRYNKNNDGSFTAYLARKGSPVNSGTSVSQTIVNNPKTITNAFIILICLAIIAGTTVFFVRKNKISKVY